MASPTEVSITLSPKSRNLLQKYMDESGAMQVSQFVVEAIHFDFSSRGMGDLCDDLWKGRDEKTASGLYQSTVEFTGKLAGSIRALQAYDSSSNWVHEILDSYAAFLVRPRSTPPFKASQTCQL